LLSEQLRFIVICIGDWNRTDSQVHSMGGSGHSACGLLQAQKPYL